MIKLSEKSRRVFRAIYRGLGVTAVSLIFQACYGPMPVEEGYGMYGMPPDYPYPVEELYIRGYVKSKKTNERITGISIWIKGVTTDYNHSTQMDGRFYFYLPKMDNYTIIFTDVDGDENGKFKQLTINLTREEAEEAEALDELIIALEEEELEEVDEE